MVESPRLVFPEHPGPALPGCNWAQIGRSGSVEYPTDGLGTTSLNPLDSYIPNASIVLVGVLIDGGTAGSDAILLGDHSLTERHTLTWTGSSQTLPFYVAYNSYQKPGLSIFASSTSVTGYVFYRVISFND